MQCRFVSSIHSIPRETWNRLCGTDYPFLRHEFFATLEDSDSTTRETGWLPHHAVVESDDDIVAVMPLFLKEHSYGEYVFDWSWADAYGRYGQDYYPKLLNAIPFTPATGPRWGISTDGDTAAIFATLANAVEQEALKQSASSCHWLFPHEHHRKSLQQKHYLERTGCQYHWLNDGYTDFEHFLASFTSRKRKNVNKERRQVSEQGISLEVKVGQEISESDWHYFYAFYHLTYLKRSGRHGYLTKAFFPLLAQALPEHLVMVQASHGKDVVAAALYFRDSHTLYGRYWGCKHEFAQLHFEACYYQGIEYAIHAGLQRFDPGAQGEHKIQRGFTPVPTYSYHWIADPEFRRGIDQFLKAETRHIHQYIEHANERLPFRCENN